MAASAFFALASVLLIQSISGQYIGNALGLGPYAAPYAGYAAPFPASFAAPYPARFSPLAAPYNAALVPSSNGGGLATSSASPVLPSGVNLLSQNAIQGPLAVGGKLPFLGTVALEGALPTAGAGSVAYGCGNGNVGMIAEEASPAYGGFYGYF